MSNLIKFKFSVFIVITGFLAFSGCTSNEKSNNNKLPACVNLNCYSNSDCGTKCVCELQSNSNLGKCVLPSKNQ